MDTTIVSMLYNLNRRDPKRDKGYRDYLKTCQMVLQINNPMVIYVDPEYKSFFEEERTKLGMKDKTMIIELPLENTKYYYLRDKFDDFRRVFPIRGYNDKKDTDYYTVMVILKFVFLSEIVNRNPFQTKYFSWMDIGLGGIIEKYHSSYPGMIDDVFRLKSEKIRMCELRPIVKSDFIENERAYYSHIRTILVSGFIVGNGKNLLEYCQLVEKEFSSMIGRHIFPNDEMISNRIYGFHPELFDVFYGDYWDCLQNYHYLRGSVDLILRNFETCRSENLRNKGIRLFEKIIESEKAGTFIMNEEQKLKFLIDAYLIYYYVNIRKAREISETIISLSTINEIFRRLILKNIGTYREYFSFLEEKKGLKVAIIHYLPREKILELSKENTVHIFLDEEENLLFLRTKQPRYFPLKEFKTSDYQQFY